MTKRQIHSIYAFACCSILFSTFAVLVTSSNAQCEILINSKESVKQTRTNNRVSPKTRDLQFNRNFRLSCTHISSVIRHLLHSQIAHGFQRLRVSAMRENENYKANK